MYKGLCRAYWGYVGCIGDYEGFVGLTRGLCRADAGYIGFIGIMLGYRTYEGVVVRFYALPFCIVHHKLLLERQSPKRNYIGARVPGYWIV